jgi:hypothetical protein
MLDRDAIVGALERLAALLRERSVEGEVCLLGGTVMVLAFRARPSTKDVDAIFHPAALVRELARTVAAERDLPPDWLNDGAKAFISERHETTDADLPQFDGLRLTAPTAEYMLAMKCMASRIAAGPGDPGDVADIAFLVSRLGLMSAAEALAIVARYYPEERIPPRAVYLLEDLFARREIPP